MIERAKEKIRQQAEQAASPMSKMLACQICDNITSSARAERVLDETKTLAGCKTKLGALASKRKNGNESTLSASDAEEVIVEYFGFEPEVIELFEKTEPIIDIRDFL